MHYDLWTNIIMLSIQNRLKDKKDFDRVFKKSRPIFSKKLSIRFTVRTKRDLPTRFGFIISNKIDKRATRRNALRRRLRAIVRSLISSIDPGYDVVVIVKQNFPYPYQYEEIEKELKEALGKAKLVK